jgi:hypothetical protein
MNTKSEFSDSASNTSRRKFLSKSRVLIAGAMLASAAGLLEESLLALGAASGATPEVDLVMRYNAFLRDNFFDWPKLLAGLPRYITNSTILHEAPSLPWGGTMVGFEGWHRFFDRNVSTVKAILPVLEVWDSSFYQSGPVVILEYGLTLKPTAAAPEAFKMGLIEKYTTFGGRITQIDEFYADTAGYLKRLRLLGAIR